MEECRNYGIIMPIYMKNELLKKIVTIWNEIWWNIWNEW